MLAKVFEFVMEDHLVHHFESNEQLSFQHGFNRKRSTISAMLDLVSRVVRIFEGRESKIFTLIDLSNICF